MERIHTCAVEIMDHIQQLETASNKHQCDSAREIMSSIWELWIWYEHYWGPGSLQSEAITPDLENARSRLVELQDCYDMIASI